MDRGAPNGLTAQSAPTLSGRVPLAVVVVDGEELVSHWSSGARRIFGHPKEKAVGRSAVDLLPVSGALTADASDLYGAYGLGPDLDASLTGHTSYPSAGRARLSDPPGEGRIDVLWWAYPLVGPGPERLLVLAADTAQLSGEANFAGEADSVGETDSTGQESFAGEAGFAGEAVERITPGFGLYTEFPGADDLARRLPEILPNMSVGEANRIVSQVLELGYPVLEFSQHDRVPVTPDWGVPRRADRKAARIRSAVRTVPETAQEYEADLEYAAARERLEFLNEVSGRIGTSLDLARTIREVTSAAVPRFADFAGTHLRAAALAGEGFAEGVPDVTTVWQRVWVEHNDEPGRWDDTVPVGEAIAFPEHTPFFQCMVTGEPVLIPRITEEMGNRISGEFEKRDLPVRRVRPDPR